jgi:UDP-glucose 4-epimerase
MSTVLVTGGAGFIGSHVVSALLHAGHAVRVLDNLSTGKIANLGSAAKEIEFIEASITDESALARATAGVDCIFHQAALASVPRSVDRPLDTHFACATGTIMLLDQARRANVRRVVYAASSSAYGNSTWLSKREADPIAPLSPYAAAKIAGEQYCLAFFHSYGLETVCLRYFNVFGPRQNPTGPYAAVIPKFIAQMSVGERPVIFGDGHQSRDFTFVENVVHANLLAAKAPPSAAGNVYNVATGKSCSLLKIVEMLNRLLKTDLQPQFNPPRVGDVRDSLADISKAQRELGYEPKVTLEEGLVRTVNER